MGDLIRKQELTVEEAAEVLRLSPVTVYRLVESGDLDSWRKTATSGIRVYTHSVLNYIKNVQGREIPVASK